MRLIASLRAAALPLAVAALALCTPATAQKKLVELGNDIPDTAYVRANIADMEALPFDGVVLRASYSNGGPTPADLGMTVFGATPISSAQLQPATADLQATSFHHFTDNFLRLGVTPGNVDWFDDTGFAVIVANFRAAAQVVLQAGLKGIFFDLEPYQGQLFDYTKLSGYPGVTYAAYSKQARLRGAQLIAVLQAEAPGLTLFLSFGYTYAHYGSLLGPFLDGFVGAAQGTSTIVDGYERSYPYNAALQFLLGYLDIKIVGQFLCAYPAQYVKYVKAGFATWLDLNSDKVAWNGTDPSKNVVTPTRLQQTLTYGLKQSEKYVWLYTQTPTWWPRSQMPDAYPAAIKAARKTLGMPVW